MTDWFEFPNLGVSINRLNDQELAPIWEEVRAIQANWLRNPHHGARLAGQFEHEYTLIDSKPHLAKIIEHLTDEYHRKYDYLGKISMMDQARPIQMGDPWVNFQRKGETNPIHTHGGVMSFVLWLQLPYSIAEEEAQGPGAKSARNLAGHFSFHYSGILGNLNHYHIPADYKQEGTLMLFPSELAHSVNPYYTSDEYRISISGNVHFKT